MHHVLYIVCTCLAASLSSSNPAERDEPELINESASPPMLDALVIIRDELIVMLILVILIYDTILGSTPANPAALTTRPWHSWQIPQHSRHAQWHSWQCGQTS